MSYFETRGLAVGYNGQVLIHDIRHLAKIRCSGKIGA